MHLFRATLLTILATSCGTQAATGPGPTPSGSTAEGSAASPAAPQGAAAFREVAAGLPEPLRVVYVSPYGGGNG